MRDEPESLTLMFLRRVDARMDCLPDVQADLSHGMTSPGGHVASLHGDVASQSLRLSHLDLQPA